MGAVLQWLFPPASHLPTQGKLTVAGVSRTCEWKETARAPLADSGKYAKAGKGGRVLNGCDTTHPDTTECPASSGRHPGPSWGIKSSCSAVEWQKTINCILNHGLDRTACKAQPVDCVHCNLCSWREMKNQFSFPLCARPPGLELP